MAKITKKETDGLNKKIHEYLLIKDEMKKLEEKAKLLADVIFATPELLPKTIIVDFEEYEKEYKLITNAPRVDITYPMLKGAKIDPTPLLPFATFAAGKIEVMMGKPAVAKIKATKEYLEAAKDKSSTYYYKG